MYCIHHVSKIGGMLFFLGLLLALLAACSGGSSASTQSTGVSSSFNTMLKTSDGMFQIQFTVTPNHLGLNTFTVNVDDANSGKPATNLQVQLSTTMLEMAMGTDTLDLPSSGNGHYSTQGTLAMAGNWEIHMLLRTPDATLHEAQVQLSTQG
ncbi:MAG TPA: FixH family protein [Ktedonobacteraceae bacterium]|jgi:hypothetical protein|nr:FixH family protein [Ktedonobacteraceae bacterium]